MRPRRAVVVGSTNVDLVLSVPVLPAPGETVLSTAVERHPGGKGANQAAALAHLGMNVRFVSAVGHDHDGSWSREHLVTAGVDVTDVATVEAPTGLAVVAVDPHGENSIVVSPGANHDVRAPQTLDADVVLLSLEVPLETVAATARLAQQDGIPVVLNAAPAQPLAPALLAGVDVLIVNELEWQVIGEPASDQVVVTLGSAGCRVLDHGRASQIPAVPVDVVDTTGAGDCFAAAVAYGVAHGWSLDESASFATRAAALAVTAAGARGRLPSASEVAH